MQSTPKPRRRQRYQEIKPGRHARYRRVIPPERRHLFEGKTEFVRSLKEVSYQEAHAEYEARARSATPAANTAADPHREIDALMLRQIADAGTGEEEGEGRNLLEYAEQLERHASAIRGRIAVGAGSPLLSVAADRAEHIARIARGERPEAIVTLKRAAERFLATVKAPSTLKVYRPRVGYIVAAMGAERDVRDITRADCRKYAQETIHRIPAHVEKKWPGVRLLEAMELAQAAGEPTIKHETKYGCVTLLRRFFAWCEEEELIDASPANAVPTPKGKRGKREDFTSAQLKIIFNAEPYTPDLREREPGAFWLPLLALYSGARIAELVMLRREDVKHEHGVAFLDFREFPGRTIKNASSIRQTPLHPEIIALGFMEYVAKLPEGSWLFPDQHNVKRPSDAFGKAFAKRLDDLGIVAPELTFHSFRHTFSTGCREAGIEKPIRDRLGGWSTGGAAEGYGRYPLKVLARELAKLHFDIDLTHLHRG